MSYFCSYDKINRSKERGNDYMAIHFIESSKQFILQTKTSTYQMQIGKFGYLLHVYYGKRVKESDLSYLIQELGRGFSGSPYEAGTDNSFSLDILPQEYSTFGNGDYRTSAIMVRNADGSMETDLRYQSHRIYKGKEKLEGLPAAYGEEAEVETLVITLEDKVNGLKAELSYSVFEEEDAITRSTKLINSSQQPFTLERALTMSIDYSYPDKMDIISFYGKHAMERQLERTPLRHGKTAIGSVRGCSSHHHNPMIILCDHNAGEDYGNCYGFSFVYSGNFLAEAEVDQAEQIRFAMGIADENFSFTLKKEESFQTPEVICVYSGEGFQKLSSCYHHLYRNHLVRGKYKNIRRPILINNWEATYFDFNEEKLIKIAEEASKLGVELFVMDDGWFGKRDNDLAGLGDWTVNTKKIKGGLPKLCERINQLGMKFGIWFEPEMVNEDSDLYRTHPDWCLKTPSRQGVRSRYQFVLDISRQEVIHYLYHAICDVLENSNIEYVKWDMNRHLANVYSKVLPPERQGEVYHRYVLGLYELLEKLIEKFPNVLFEGCSGGGGRFDAGMLYYTPQIWCSDNTDAIDRLKIQYGTSFGYPINTMGAHVSACPNHQNGRITPLSTRGIVAMSGTFGYELDISKMTEKEKEIVKEQIETFKTYAELIAQGEYYRLSDAMDESLPYTAWEYVAENKSEALLSYVQLHPKANPFYYRVKWKGLDPEKNYRMGKELYRGEVLMNIGCLMPILQGDYQALQVHIQAEK